MSSRHNADDSNGIEVGGARLLCTPDFFQYGSTRVPMDKVLGLTWYQYDHRLKGFLAYRTRDLIIADGSPRGFCLAFGGISPIGDPDEQFWSAYHYLSRTLLQHLAERHVERLLKEGQLSIAGVVLTRSGVVIPGRWRFLWMEGAPRLISWLDVVV